MSADITDERIAEWCERIAEELEQTTSPHGATAHYARIAGKALDALLSARSQLAALQSVPQGVEVPQMGLGDLDIEYDFHPEDRSIDIVDEAGTIANINEWIREHARLVPIPPQAALDLVDEVNRILSGVKRYAFDTTKGEYFEIAHGAFMKVDHVAQAIYKRYTPPQPLHPEERRGVVPRITAMHVEELDRQSLDYKQLAEELNRWFAPSAVGPDEVPDRAAWLTIEEMAEVIYCNISSCSKKDARFVAEMVAAESKTKALRTSAQDHNGEGAR